MKLQFPGFVSQHEQRLGSEPKISTQIGSIRKLHPLRSGGSCVGGASMFSALLPEGRGQAVECRVPEGRTVQASKPEKMLRFSGYTES